MLKSQFSFTILPMISIVFSGAIFGFFYAWVSSTMWGLDTADPRIAIAAMQAMNASVRNVVFAPIFFATPFVLAITGVSLWAGQKKPAAFWFILAALIYILGGLFLTMTINVPMNEALARIEVPKTIEDARFIWSNYSGEWQFWNQVRTIISGISLCCAAFGMLKISR